MCSVALCNRLTRTNVESEIQSAGYEAAQFVNVALFSVCFIHVCLLCSCISDV